jgi:hypothetical protein
MSKFIDSMIAIRIVKLLSTPIEKSDAFKLGIIDRNGNLKRKPQTIKEEDSYTLLNKIVFKLQKVLHRAPNSEQELRQIAASAKVVSECYENNNLIENIELNYIDCLNNIDDDYITEFFESINKKRVKSFSDFINEEDGGGDGGSAPANNASVTKGVDGFTPETTPVKKKEKLLRRKKLTLF